MNPTCSQVEELTCYPDSTGLPVPVRCASVITRPEVTEKIVDDAVAAGTEFLWMQPGAESPAAIVRAEQSGITVIAGGPCILVALGFQDV